MTPPARDELGNARRGIAAWPRGCPKFGTVCTVVRLLLGLDSLGDVVCISSNLRRQGRAVVTRQFNLRARVMTHCMRGACVVLGSA